MLEKDSVGPQLKPPVTGLWRNADFLKLWAGQTVSEFGSLLPTLSFVAILTLEATPFQVAMVAAANTAPGLLFGLPAGVWVDRVHRRPILIAADIGRFALLASIPAAHVLGVLRIEHLYLVAFLTGTLSVFFEVGFRSYVPSLVRQEELIEANSKLSATSSAVEVAAFSAGGWLVQWFTAIVTTLIDALTFLVSAVCLVAIRAEETQHPPAGQHQSLRREITEGLQTVWRQPLLRPIAVEVFAGGFGGGIFTALWLLFGIREVGFQPAALGMIAAVGGLSSLVGAAFAQRITRRVGVGPALAFGALICAAPFTPLAGGPLLVAGTLLVMAQLTDGAATVYQISQISLRQTIVPDRLLGRVNASMRVVRLGALLLGSLLAGVLGEAIGLRPTIAIGSGAMVAGALWLVASPVRALRDMPTPESQGEARQRLTDPA